MNFFYQPDLISGTGRLNPEDSFHCIKVLRKKKGDTIRVIDGKGSLYQCMITEADAAGAGIEMTEKTEYPRRELMVHIAISPTKSMDRLEWFLEKAVEIGIDRISLIRCKNSERKVVKTDRLTRKAVSALKQSGNLFLPEIRGMIAFEELITAAPENTGKFIAHAAAPVPDHLMRFANQHKHNVVLIGPEGDFSPDELKKAEKAGFIPVSLGPSRLRTETAGLLSCIILNLADSQAGQIPFPLTAQ